MGQKYGFNPFTKAGLDLVGDADSFITATTSGVITIRWVTTPGGFLYDMTLDDTGHVVTTLVSSTSGGADIFGLLLTRNLS